MRQRFQVRAIAGHLDVADSKSVARLAKLPD
jgi:hypothetical protein